MKILITGARGMLGRTLQKRLSGHELTLCDLPELDITDKPQLDALFRREVPEAVIHCAAMTQVDKCEGDKALAFKVNAEGAGNVATFCSRYAARLIAVSTDYVFDGSLDRPYSEYDIPDGGRTVYGQSKFAGEELIRALCPQHIIARTAWLYGSGGPSFVHTMLGLADGSRPELKVVNDQRGNPTSCAALADKLAEFLNHPALTGVFHCSCEGEASWYDFAYELFARLGIKQKIVPCGTAEFPRPAARPANSRLEKRRLRECMLLPMPDWKTALKDFLAGDI